MQYVEAPNIQAIQAKSLFLAGGISNCPNWQAQVVEALNTTALTLCNPRRADFPMGNPSAAEAQIKWEFEYLRQVDAVLFWFPKETLCPITLYELGVQSVGNKPLFLGIHPAYQRRQDVEIQLQLARPGVELQYSLDDLVKQVKEAWTTI